LGAGRGGESFRAPFLVYSGYPVPRLNAGQSGAFPMSKVFVLYWKSHATLASASQILPTSCFVDAKSGQITLIRPDPELRTT
jgi:hypothetical protein